MAFDLLSSPIKKFIYDKGWGSLRPIQAAAISKILSTSENYILAARTASGKTEAAFLPILSKVNFLEPGVQILYISPLIALINDQFLRVEELCKYLDVPVTKWHGEANKSMKKAVLAKPEGIVLITPESLEAMLINKPFHIAHLFSKLKYVVIDEIHSFIGTDRGVHLKSILSRLQAINVSKFIVLGLSATIGDYSEAKRFTGNEEGTKVLLDRTAKDIDVAFRYFGSDAEELPLDLLKDLYKETWNKKVLIFPNSRGRAEEIAVKLSLIAKKVNGHSNYFSHHSSVDKDVREYVESFAKSSHRQNFCISCTSTLELGIDIGTVDEVVQIDSTHSIASLIQRVGRSGRKDGASSYLKLYATNPWSLLQSLACWLLYTEGIIEPSQALKKPFDILLHQILSEVKSKSSLQKQKLENCILTNFAFNEIGSVEVVAIIDHLLTIGFLENINGELIVGVEGERVVNSREFYSVFKAEENLKVVNAGNTIGQIPYSPQIVENENILLAAKIWKIKLVDVNAKLIQVIPAYDGKKPMFFGGVANTHTIVRQKMLEILFDDKIYEIIDGNGIETINTLRLEFSSCKLKNKAHDRPIFSDDKYVTLYTFMGSKFNRTLSFLLQVNGLTNILDDKNASVEIECTIEDFRECWSTILNPLSKIDDYIADVITTNPGILSFSKFAIYLPYSFQIALLKTRYFDFDEVSSIKDWCLVYADN
jgi:ATP-dependent helicase Lhr and Lhr-like helicase